MENEIQNLKQAKIYMEYLANGVDPIRNTDADVDTLHNELIIACFRYVAKILENHITQSEIIATQTKPSLLPEQHVSLEKGFHRLAYPADVSIHDFIKLYPDHCLIVAIGSCNTWEQKGSYTAILLCKGRSKVLTKSNISTTSSNKCILMGLIDAASAIKTQADIIILCSTSLGFASSTTPNRELCWEVRQILAQKGCNVAFTACNGRGEELRYFVQNIISQTQNKINI